jgi:hypothetical protein
MCKKDICNASVDYNGCQQCPTYACVLEKDIDKRAIEIKKRIAAVDSQAADCAESCEALVNYCINVSFDLRSSECGEVTDME